MLGGLAAAIAILAGLLLYGLSLETRAIEGIYLDRVVPLRDLKGVSDSYAITVVDNAIKAELGTIEFSKAADAIEAAVTSAETKWKAYIKTTLTDEERMLVVRTDPLLEVARPTIKRIVTALKAGDKAELSRLVHIDMYRHIEPLTQAFNQLVNLQTAVTNEIYAKVQRTSTLFMALAWVVVVVAAVAVIAALIFMRRWVTEPIGAMTDTMLALAKGDLELTIPFADRENEIGHMAHAAEVFRCNMLEFRKLQERAVEDAERASKAKGDFLTSMSHELRTPLNAIIGIVEMVLEDAELEEGREEDVEGLTRVLGAARHLLALINDILDLSKIEAGHLDLQVERVLLEPIIEEALGTVRPLQRRKAMSWNATFRRISFGLRSMRNG